MSDPGLLEELEVSFFACVKLTSASSHDVTVARDGVCHVEVGDRVCEESAAQISLARGLVGKLVDAAVLDHVVTNKVRSELS